MRLDLSEHHFILFDSQTVPVVREGELFSKDYLSLTLLELEQCIAWIPLDKKVLIYSLSGFTPRVLNRLKNLRTARHLYLLKATRHSRQSIGIVKACTQ